MIKFEEIEWDAAASRHFKPLGELQLALHSDWQTGANLFAILDEKGERQASMLVDFETDKKGKKGVFVEALGGANGGIAQKVFNQIEEFAVNYGAEYVRFDTMRGGLLHLAARALKHKQISLGWFING